MAVSSRFRLKLFQVNARRLTCLQNFTNDYVSRSISTSYTLANNKDGTEKKIVALVSQQAAPKGEFREMFVPITRRSIVRHLMQEKDFLTEIEQQNFEHLALALDAAIVNKYHGLLEDIKALFDPINPDKDTIQTRKWNRRERLDNEFWLLQKLSSIMEKANFHELSKETVAESLSTHNAREGVMVKVDTEKYDVMRFWALGKEVPPMHIPLYQRLFNRLLRRADPAPLEFYKRVVVAVRLKRDDKLILKAFKEVPAQALEQLLPDGKIQMSKLDKGVLTTTISIAVLGVLAKIVTVLAHLSVDWTLIVTAVTGLAAVRAWTVYKNRRNTYLLQLSRMLYFKNIANNRGLLTLLVDRAEDELFKEALLTYTFLLVNGRKPQTLEQGAIAKSALEREVSDWVERKTKVRVHFDISDAENLLSEIGLLNRDYNNDLYVLGLEPAIRNLPLTANPALVQRLHEQDMVEGYERDVTDEDESDYKEEETKRKKYGWF